MFDLYVENAYLTGNIAPGLVGTNTTSVDENGH